MKPLSAQELAHWLHDKTRAQPLVLDVREPWEQQICLIDGSQTMAMQNVQSQLQELEASRPVVCVCHHGIRSAHIAMFLQQQGFDEVYNLTGGIDAWARQIDPAMATY